MHRIEIQYCVQCRWLLRAAWIAQELLTTFEKELTEVALKPGIGGIFEVRVNGYAVFSRKATGRFPEIKELKQLVRDIVAPGEGSRAFGEIGFREEKMCSVFSVQP